MPPPSLEQLLESRFDAVLDDLEARSRVAEHILDKDFYRILVATLWVNVVLAPEDVGIDDSHLEPLHDVMNRRIARVLGAGETLTGCFRYLDGKHGERAMREARLTATHRDMLLYFASVILDPQGHRRWLDELRDRPSR